MGTHQQFATCKGSREKTVEEIKTTARPSLPDLVCNHLGRQLQSAYSLLAMEEQPQRFLDLISQLDVVLAAQDTRASSMFRSELLASVPALRAFALSLVGNSVRADDIVQETLLKAWANQHRFVPGTNLMAWLYTILRNYFYSECRKGKREVEDADGVAAGQLIALPSQEHGIELQQVWAILAKLPSAQREALLLVAGQGMTYEAAAALVGSQVGTMKSRVSRARAFLAGSLGKLDERTPF